MATARESKQHSHRPLRIAVVPHTGPSYAFQQTDAFLQSLRQRMKRLLDPTGSNFEILPLPLLEPPRQVDVWTFFFAATEAKDLKADKLASTIQEAVDTYKIDTNKEACWLIVVTPPELQHADDKLQASKVAMKDFQFTEFVWFAVDYNKEAGLWKDIDFGRDINNADYKRLVKHIARLSKHTPILSSWEQEWRQGKHKVTISKSDQPTHDIVQSVYIERSDVDPRSAEVVYVLDRTLLEKLAVPLFSSIGVAKGQVSVKFSIG